jgi:cold shock CspA family protein
LIRPDDGSKARFFHISDIAGDETPASGDVVTFTMGEDDRGRSKAKEVTLEGRARRKHDDDHERI